MLLEGVKYEINWRAFRRGTAIFLPCLNRGAAKREVERVCGRMRIKILVKPVIHEGIKGLRIWRQ